MLDISTFMYMRLRPVYFGPRWNSGRRGKLLEFSKYLEKNYLKYFVVNNNWPGPAVNPGKY